MWIFCFALHHKFVDPNWIICLEYAKIMINFTASGAGLAEQIWIINCGVFNTRSIAAPRDHFVRHLSVCPSICLSGIHTSLVVTQSYVSQGTHAFLGMLPLFCILKVIVRITKHLVQSFYSKEYNTLFINGFNFCIPLRNLSGSY